MMGNGGADHKIKKSEKISVSKNPKKHLFASMICCTYPLRNLAYGKVLATTFYEIVNFQSKHPQYTLLNGMPYGSRTYFWKKSLDRHEIFRSNPLDF